MPLRPIKPKGKIKIGRPIKETIGTIEEMLLTVKGIYEMEVLRLKDKVCEGPLKPMDHKTLTECTKNLILLSKEERSIRSEEDFDGMDDKTLHRIAESALDSLKKPVKQNKVKPKEETTESESQDEHADSDPPDAAE